MGVGFREKENKEVRARMRWCDGTAESGQKMRISVPPAQHVSLTLNPRAWPGLKCTTEGKTIAAVVMISPYKAMLCSRAEQGTEEVGGVTGEGVVDE